MSTKESGGPAFPGNKRIYRAGYTTSEVEPVAGMELRDYFAAKAMQGLIQDHTQSDERHYKSLANTSYAMADAMLEARG